MARLRTRARIKGVTIELLGDDELARRFAELEGVAQERIFRSAAKKAGVPVLNSAVSNVKVLTGALADSLDIETIRFKKRQGMVGVRITTGTRTELGLPAWSGTGPGSSYYPMSLEAGTSRMQAYPYMRPALKDNEGKVKRILRVEIGKGIDRAVRRLNKKRAKLAGFS